MKYSFKGQYNKKVKQAVQLTKDNMASLVSWKPVVIKDSHNSPILKTVLLHELIYDNHDKSTKEDVFYLKINRDDEAALSCIQGWLDVVGEFPNPVLYFVCDSPHLKRIVLGRCRFPRHASVTFLGSRLKEIEPVCRNLYTGNYWKNATYAHVLPFWHAKKQRIKRHWDIDADDTMFLLPASHVFKALRQAEAYATEHHIDAFSLDMWRSRTAGRHWSFGVAFINETVDFYNILSMNRDTQWAEQYAAQKLDNIYNIDWYFTHLKDNGLAVIEAFYIENSSFIHCSLVPFFRPIYGSLCQWHNGTLRFPVLLELYHDQTLGLIPIAEDEVKIDISLSGEEASTFMQEKFGKLSEVEKNRFSLPDHS